VTFRLFLELLAGAGGIAGFAFLVLYFRKGLPGRALLPGPVRLLVTVALVTDSVAAIVYSILVTWRLVFGDAPVATTLYGRLISVFIILAAVVPAMALLTVGLYVHFARRGGGQGWLSRKDQHD
jgi:hypothetical protein